MKEKAIRYIKKDRQNRPAERKKRKASISKTLTEMTQNSTQACTVI